MLNICGRLWPSGPVHINTIIINNNSNNDMDLKCALLQKIVIQSENDGYLNLNKLVVMPTRFAV